MRVWRGVVRGSEGVEGGEEEGEVRVWRERCRGYKGEVRVWRVWRRGGVVEGEGWRGR